MFEALPATVLLVATGGGVGALLRRLLRRRLAANGHPTAAPLGGAATVLLGLFALAALLPNLCALGVPHSLCLLAALALALAGWWTKPDLRQLRLPTFDVVVLGALLALLLATPAWFALTRPVLSSDALVIWWPKVAEVAAGNAPQLTAVTPEHHNPFYPRGGAWLVNLAGAASPDHHTLRLVPVVITWLTAMAFAAAARALGRPRLGALTAVLFVLLPDVAQQCHSGMFDVFIAASVLCAGVGLARRREHADFVLLAIAGGVGAVAIKEEGVVVLAVVGLCFGFDVVVACRQARRLAASNAVSDAAANATPRAAASRLLALGVAALVLVPFALLRGAAPQTRFDTLGPLLAEPDMLLRRVFAVGECLGFALLAPSSLRLDHETAFAMQAPVSAWVVALGLLWLLGQRRRVGVLPAVSLIAAALFVQVASAVDVRWHMRTTLPRLAVEVVALVLLAVVTAERADATRRN